MRWLSRADDRGRRTRFIDGVWAIFGHGNVAGIGEALHGIGDALPTWRGQNEQTMAHAAIAYAKTQKRRRAHGGDLLDRAGRDQHGDRGGAGPCQPPAGAVHPAATSLPTARPDPVLQQIEDFDDGTVSANDCFRPVSALFRPHHAGPSTSADRAAARACG